MPSRNGEVCAIWRRIPHPRAIQFQHAIQGDGHQPILLLINRGGDHLYVMLPARSDGVNATVTGDRLRRLLLFALIFGGFVQAQEPVDSDTPAQEQRRETWQRHAWSHCPFCDGKITEGQSNDLGLKEHSVRCGAACHVLRGSVA
jgi:hypothetical protein